MRFIIPPLPDDATNAWVRWAIGKATIVKVWEAAMFDQYVKGATHAAILIVYLLILAYLAGRKRGS